MNEEFRAKLTNLDILITGLSLALVHSSTNMLKWVWASGFMEATRPHKHVQISQNQKFFCLTSLSTIISQ